MPTKKVKHRKVPLAGIKTLTLRAGQLTTGRRGEPGKHCTYSPQVVQCRQTGSDGVSPQWACEADLPEGLRFGPLEVVCEGWSGPGDDQVLAGSCALEYELEGRPEAAHAAFGSWAAVGEQGPDYSGYAIKALWVAVALFMLYKLLRVRVRWDPNGGRRPPGGPGGPGGWGGGGGGGPGGDDWTPPPPYTPHAKPDPATAPPAQGLGARPQSTQGPGFWTGMAAGAGAAAALNWARNRNGQGAQAQRQREDAGDYARWRAQRPAQRSWADYEPPSRDAGPSDAGPSRRATGFGGSRTR